MAKGFTVKAAAPEKKKAEDWDIAAIKERMKGKRLYSVCQVVEYHLHF